MKVIFICIAIIKAFLFVLRKSSEILFDFLKSDYVLWKITLSSQIACNFLSKTK